MISYPNHFDWSTEVSSPSFVFAHVVKVSVSRVCYLKEGWEGSTWRLVQQHSQASLLLRAGDNCQGPVCGV